MGWQTACFRAVGAYDVLRTAACPVAGWRVGASRGLLMMGLTAVVVIARNSACREVSSASGRRCPPVSVGHCLGRFAGDCNTDCQVCLPGNWPLVRGFPGLGAPASDAPSGGGVAADRARRIISYPSCGRRIGNPLERARGGLGTTCPVSLAPQRTECVPSLRPAGGGPRRSPARSFRLTAV